MSINRLGLILIVPLLVSGCVKKKPVVSTYVVTAPDRITVLRGDFEKNVGNKIYYGFNSYTLSEEARSHLRRQAEWLLRHPSVTVNIDGHCDKIGDKNYNLALGLKRAEAAKKFLVEQGVDASRITVSSSGKDWQDGISYNDPWQSRFVTVLILSA